MATIKSAKPIKANVWGAQTTVYLTTWEHIKSLGFKANQRSFGTIPAQEPRYKGEEVQALFFNGSCVFPFKDGTQPNNGRNEWYVTTETIEDILDK